jgi:hypothetical protein
VHVTVVGGVVFARRPKVNDPGVVVRLAAIAVVVGAVSGCDVVLGTDYFDPVPPLCGPYGPASPVQYDPAIGNPTDFSVAGDGMHGLVSATYNNVTGATPIMLGTDGIWLPDVAKLGGNTLAKAVTGGHMGTTGDVFAWLDHSKNLGFPIIVRYVFTTVWSPIVPNVAESNLDDLIPGNEVESDAGFNAVTRYVVELSQAIDGGAPGTLTILVAAPASDVFKASDFANAINDVEAISPTGAALTADHGILVYSAKVGTTEGHLFESSFTKSKFGPGHGIESLYMPGKADDQPWINNDCTQIWFRRDGLTWTARKM